MKAHICIACGIEYKRKRGVGSPKRCPMCHQIYKSYNIVTNAGHRPSGHRTRNQHKKVRV